MFSVWIVFTRPKLHDDLFASQIFVFFPEDMKIGVKIIKNYVIRMENENVRRAIVVVRIDMTPSAKACQTEIAGRFQVEVFKVTDNVFLLVIRIQNGRVWWVGLWAKTRVCK